VPVTEGGLILQVLIAFAVIGLFAFVLRWTFRHDRKAGSVFADPPTSAPSGGPDDFGLLGTVAVVETSEEAARMRRVLGDAGIRATVSGTGDGRYRVLVFNSEVNRARRVGGWSA
jgi:hypothetical protein